MRIGMVTACYHPVVNGVTRMISHYKRKLEERGHEVTVFTLGRPAPHGDEPGVVRSAGIPLGDTGYYLGIRYSKSAQALLQEMDILHCHHLFMSVEMARRYATCPIVFTNHTRYDLYTSAYTPLPQPAADAVMRQLWPQITDLCQLIIAPSPSVRQVLEDFGVKCPIVVIENGIDLAPFDGAAEPVPRESLGFHQDGFVLVYVGRLSAEKNVSTLLAQFAIAQKLIPELYLLIVGDGPHSGRLEEQLRRLGIARQVCFAGRVAYEDLPAHLAAADAFVTASMSEVHPLSVIEALASALPVIGMVSPGIADIVEHGVTGLLAEPREDGLAANIVALARDSGQRASMSAAARLAGRRFDINRTVSLTLAHYERLLHEARNGCEDRRGDRSRRSGTALWPVIEELSRMLRPPQGRGGDHDGAS